MARPRFKITHRSGDCSGRAMIVCDQCGQEQVELEEILSEDLCDILREAAAAMEEVTTTEEVMETDRKRRQLEHLAALIDPDQRGMYPTG